MPNVSTREWGYAACLILLAGLWLAPEIQAQSGTNVTVAFSTTGTMPLSQGFAGFACEMLDTGLEYDNTNFQHFVASLSPGWIRYPSGISDDAFDWFTGLTDTNWINVIAGHGETSSANSCHIHLSATVGQGRRAVHQFCEHDPERWRGQNHRLRLIASLTPLIPRALSPHLR